MSELAPEEVVWDLLRGGLAARALGIVTELRVAEALAGGPRTVDELATDLGADPDTLYRLLRALASDGVFAEVEPGMFGNTPASELLADGGRPAPGKERSEPQWRQLLAAGGLEPVRFHAALIEAVPAN